MSAAHRSTTGQRARKVAPKRERLEARISPQQKALWERAAALGGQTLSQFVLASAQRAAEDAIRRHEVITLSARDSLAIMEALQHPPAPSSWLREAAEYYKAVMGDE
jgi:uncharacterized protein (DUF1778 family)